MIHQATVRLATIVAVCASLVACAPQARDHGYLPPSDALDQITIGVDTRDSVAETIGAPGTAGVVNDGGFFYVRSRVEAVGFRAPEVVSRTVLAIRFDADGVVRNIETFGLEDGQVVPISRRVTESSISDKTFLRQLLGNLGRISPDALTN